jgi:hypothetical protein
MCSVRRLARMLASHATHSAAPPPSPPTDRGGREARIPLPPADLVIQKRGADSGRLARLDSLGLVLRVKRPDESALF